MNAAIASHDIARTNTGVIEQVADRHYRLLRALPAGEWSAAYLAVDTSNGQPVELRRIATPLDDLKQASLETRHRLVELVWHKSARKVRGRTQTAGAATVVVDFGGDESLATWSSGASPADLLAAMVQVTECLMEAHHVGLTHGSLRAATIGVWDDQPRLDFGNLSANELAQQVGTEAAKAKDAIDLASIIAAVLEPATVAPVIRSASPRDAAQLSQLLSLANSTRDEPPTLDSLASSLRSLATALGPDRHNQVASTLAVCVLPGRRSAEQLPEQAVDAVGNFNEPGTVEPGTVEPGTVELGTVELGTVELGTVEVDATATALANGGRRNVLREGDRVGRYRIVKKLGEGGMGAVYKAVDIGTDRPVALKLLTQAAHERRNAVRRFAKEARLLASLNNPYITNLIEVSDEEGIPFIALEYVDGIDLRQVLDKVNILPERAALAIVADIARGLVDAHHREIIHRDIKPENILLIGCKADDPLTPVPRAKLADFGIARHVVQSQSLAMTAAGGLLGTPTYMSPEQCRGAGEVAPTSDIYSLGVTLYELLTGAPPFVADDAMALAGMHCFDVPPLVSKQNPLVSAGVCQFVARCLAKNPDDRFADADSMLRALEQLLDGEPSTVALRPTLPPHDSRRVVSNTMTWTLNASPRDLWPLVSNTERLNRAIGLPPVEYRTQHDAQLGTQRFGTIRLAGLSMTWEEHPYEWVEGQRMSVLREFARGPFRWFVSVVELRSLASGQTALEHTVKILPRNLLGRLVATIETGTKCRRSLDRVYRRIDHTLATRDHTAIVDAFEPAAKMTHAQRLLLTTRADELLAQGFSVELVETLVRVLAESPPQQLAGMRPVAQAQQWGVDDEQWLQLLLHAAKHKLLDLQWDLLCPTCRVAADTKPSLRDIAAHTHCEACNIDFNSSLAGSIELVFRAHPDIRDTRTGVYCIGGPWHAPHVVAQLRLAPHERLELPVLLSEGDYVLRGPRLATTHPIRVQSAGAPSLLQLQLGSTIDATRTATLRAGSSTLQIENGCDQPHIVRLERTIPRHDVLTAARAAATRGFRELFPAEVLGEGQLVATNQVSMLAAALPAIDDLFAQCGDSRAFDIVERHLADATAAVECHHGEVVKIVGDVLFASFHNNLAAVKAAFDLRTRRFTEPDQPNLPRGIAVHAGPALVTTTNHRLDYFGAATRHTMALPAVVGQGVVLTEPVASAATVAAWLAEHDHVAQLQHVDLPGNPHTIVHHFPVEVQP
jgi:serine/threonine protein kinase